jgi:YHS domain-containing protein
MGKERTTKELLIVGSINIFAMPVDPVCGIEMDEKLATRLNHQGKNYYFCSEGCKKIFVKKPRKYR